MKKILVTGSKGFIGKNLVYELKEKIKNGENLEVIEIDINNSNEELVDGIKESDLIIHLAGVNRPKDENEFREGNTNFTKYIIEVLKENKKNTPIIITSSIQADLHNAYGISKKEAEEALLDYSNEMESKVYIYRLPNVFGKWCRPNYNSAVATFCNNIARGEEIWVSDRSREIRLVYIDDVVRNIINVIEGNDNISGYKKVDIEYETTLGEIVDLLNEFKDGRGNRYISNMEWGLSKKLYSTYLSYLPEDEFSYDLKMNIDNRGSFTEFIKSKERGQVSVNISKPGIIKGNHWHNTKNEKFLVVSGEGIIRLRKIDEEEVFEYKVSGDKLEVVDIPIGYTHNIENIGKDDMVTIMWVNEPFSPKNPDTYYLKV